MNLRNKFQSSSKNSVRFQGLSSSASNITPASVAGRPTSKQKSAEANDLGDDGLKQLRLQAKPASMFGTKRTCCNTAWYFK